MDLSLVPPDAWDMVFGVLRTASGIALVTVLPGLALSYLLAPSLGGLTRLGWAVALSLITNIITGLALTSARLPFDGLSWYVALGAVSLVAAAAALIRRPALRAVRPHRIAWKTWRIVPVVGALAALGLVAFYGRQSALAAPQAGFTQLWVLPGDQDSVVIGVRNHEQVDAEFRVVVWSGADRVAEWQSVPLGHGEAWVRRLEFASPASLRDLPLEVRLYWADNPGAAYRRVSLACGLVNGENIDAVQAEFRQTARCAVPTATATDAMAGVPAGAAADQLLPTDSSTPNP